jgi:hypothetical protein
LPISDGKRSEAEIQTFVRLALAERFNSEAPSSGYLSVQETERRSKEQKELTEQKMRQLIIVGSVEIKSDRITVDADRLIAVQNIRSVFRFPTEVRLETIKRSKSNPYGLLLAGVEPIIQQKAKEEQ